MSRDALSRRDFHRLAAAAFGGAVAGSIVGCGKGGQDASTAVNADNAVAAADPSGKELVGGEKPGVHACRGLNQCKNLGKSKNNACAGQGTCATTKEHTCHTENECKYLGGCGESAGANACKRKGECAVPMVAEDTWKKAREAFEKRMAEKNKKVGPAPSKS
ncbi:MAG: twin-arginine translocation signal domain-containing protein [Planctomycetales bacterium]